VSLSALEKNLNLKIVSMRFSGLIYFNKLANDAKVFGQ